MKFFLMECCLPAGISFPPYPPRPFHLAGRSPVADWASSRCPDARRCIWSRSAQPPPGWKGELGFGFWSPATLLQREGRHCSRSARLQANGRSKLERSCASTAGVCDSRERSRYPRALSHSPAVADAGRQTYRIIKNSLRPFACDPAHQRQSQPSPVSPLAKANGQMRLPSFARRGERGAGGSEWGKNTPAGANQTLAGARHA